MPAGRLGFSSGGRLPAVLIGRIGSVGVARSGGVGRRGIVGRRAGLIRSRVGCAARVGLIRISGPCISVGLFDLLCPVTKLLGRELRTTIFGIAVLWIVVWIRRPCRTP